MLENLHTVIARLRELRAERRDERGASAVEYGLLVAGIAALVAVIVFALGGTVQGAFDDACDSIAGDGVATEANCAP
jgi:pilus assembly protein Flp/PilA